VSAVPSFVSFLDAQLDATLLLALSLRLQFLSMSVISTNTHAWSEFHFDVFISMLLASQVSES